LFLWKGVFMGGQLDQPMSAEVDSRIVELRRRLYEQLHKNSEIAAGISCRYSGPQPEGIRTSAKAEAFDEALELVKELFPEV